MKSLIIVSKGQLSLNKVKENIEDYLYEVFKKTPYHINKKNDLIQISNNDEISPLNLHIGFNILKVKLSIKISGEDDTDDLVVDGIIDAINEKVEELTDVEISDENDCRALIEDSESILDIPKLIEELHKLKEKKLIDSKEFDEKRKKLLDKI